VEEPRFVITSKDHTTPHPMPFKKLFSIKESLISLALIWPTNSYYVNIQQEHFVINGGLYLKMSEYEGAKCIEYRRRRRKDLSADGSKVLKQSMFYLLGWKVENRYLFLEISEDGKKWEWRNRL